MARRKATRASESPQEPSKAPPALTTSLLRESFQDAALAVLERFRQRVKHPDYDATPGDVIGVIRAMRELEESDALFASFTDKLEEARKELKALEDHLLGMFQGLGG